MKGALGGLGQRIQGIMEDRGTPLTLPKEGEGPEGSSTTVL